jgi:hypothetical protein
VSRFDELESCGELTPDIAREAASSRESMRDFLSWAAATARPDEGAPKVLLAIAQLGEAGWVDGTLYIDIAGDDSVTKLSIFADYGFGIRERLLPLARLLVPFDEFVRAVRLAPKLIAPFHSEQIAGSLVLTPPNATAEDPLESIAISEASLAEEPKTAPPPAGVADALTKPPPSNPEQSGIHTQQNLHTHPTVRRMVAIKPEARRSSRDD